MDDLEDAAIAPEDEVARICADLIRIESVNYGDGSGPGERKAAEYVMDQLTEVGLDPVLVESEPGRATVMHPHRGRGHLAARPRRARPPRRRPGQRRRLAGRPVLRRGARRLHLGPRRGRHEGHGRDDPRRTSAHLARDRRRKPARDHDLRLLRRRGGGRHSRAATGSSTTTRDWFEGVTEAISEVGGYSVTVPDAGPGSAAAYLVADRGEGHRAGCGCAPAAAPGTGRCPTTTTPSCGWPRPSAGSPPTSGRASTSPSVRAAARRAQRPHRHSRIDAGRPDAAAAPPRRRAGLRARHAARHGQRHDARRRATSTTSSRRPATASSTAASCPGTRTTSWPPIRALAGEHVEVEVVHHDIALEAPFDGDLVESMKQSLLAEDPGRPSCRTACPAAPTTRPSAGSASPGTGSRRCGCPPTSTSRRCSTASTSACPVESLVFGARVLGEFLRRA